MNLNNILMLKAYILKPTKAFTLVELIVIITIIAILSTIGFVAYSGFSSKSRDSSRVAQLKSINQALEGYTTRGKLPLPDDKVTIYASGTIIGYQGNAGEAVLNKIGIKEGGKDPNDDKYYTYSIDSKLKNIQLLAFLENDPSEDKEVTSIMNSEKGIMNNKGEQKLLSVIPVKTGIYGNNNNFLLSSGAKSKDPLNNDNISKQSSRDSSTLLGMTSGNGDGKKQEIANVLPPFVKGVGGFCP